MAGGRRGPVAAEHGSYEGGKVARRSRTSSSERRARLSPGWMRRSMVTNEGITRSSSSLAVHSDVGGSFEDTASPEGCMRWKAPEDSPEVRGNESPSLVRSASARGPRGVGRSEEVGGHHLTWVGPSQRHAASNSQRARYRRSTGDPSTNGVSGGSHGSHSCKGSRPGPELHTPPMSVSARSERSSCSDARPTPRLAGAAVRGSSPPQRPVSVGQRSGGRRAECEEHGDVTAEREALEREIHLLSERLSAAERERNWALAALRDSESSLQAALTEQSEQRRRSSNEQSEEQRRHRAEACSAGGDFELRHQHYRVLVELLNGRCCHLEQRLENEAQVAAAREEDARRTLTVLEEQTVRLGLAMVEQQRAFKIRAEELRVEQEAFMNSHRQQLEDARKQAHAEVVSLREDYKKREEMWAQDYERLTRCAHDCDDQSCREISGQLGSLLLDPSAGDMALAPIPESPEAATAEVEQGSPSRHSSQPYSPGACSSQGEYPPRQGSFAAEDIHLSDSWDGGTDPDHGVLNGEIVAHERVSSVATGARRVLDSAAPNGDKHITSGDGEQQWLLQSLPGFLSAGLPRSPSTGAGSIDSGAPSGTHSADEHTQASSSPATGTIATSTSSSAGAVSSKAPASPQFGKWPIDERSSPPRHRVGALGSHAGSTASSGGSTNSGTRGGTWRSTGGMQDSSNTGSVGSTNSDAVVASDSEKKPSPELASSEREEDVEELLSSLEGLKDPRRAARIWARIGTVQQRKKAFVEARAAYGAAVQLDSSQHGCLANLSQLEAHAGNIDVACDLLARALEIDPKNSAYHAFRQWLQSASPATQPTTPNA